MKKYYRERFEAQRRLQKKIAPLLEVNDILERLREEVRELIPSSMEGCILLLDQSTEQHVENGAPHMDAGLEIKAGQKLYFDGE